MHENPIWPKGHISANTPWLVTGYGKYGLIFCQGVFAINTPTIHVSVQLHPFHEVEIKQHRVIMTEYVFHTLEANLQHQYSFKEFRRKHEFITKTSVGFYCRIWIDIR